MALELFRWQRAHNPDYAAFCGDAAPSRIREIPAVPVGLFRDVAFCCFDPQAARCAFHTSGTTSGRAGVHRLLDSATYDLASAGWFRACLPACPQRALSLIPSPADAPRSSLSHMIGLLFPDARYLVGASGRVDAPRAWGELAASREPVFLACTSLALGALLDAAGRAQLPAGSLLMSTGGTKGRHLELDPERLQAQALERLGPQVRLVTEYGMTELCSQLWTRPAAGPAAAKSPRFLPPPWLRVLAADPGSGQVLPPGEAGQLRFVDLANDCSVLAIETMDQGLVQEDGAVQLQGRLPGARPRGCSLTVEEAAKGLEG